MSISKLNPHYSFENPASVYDEEALTALELAGRTTAKINEVVDAQNALRKNTEDHLSEQDSTIEQRMNAQDQRITTMNDVTMPAKVTSEINKKIADGTFADEIDRYAGNLEQRVNTLLGEVAEGSTTMDAEVIDIRTPVEGDKHPNAGAAVRAAETKAIDIRNRADGGFVCFHNNWDKLTDWGSNVPIGSCITVDGDSLKWYYRENIPNNPGVAIPVKRIEGAKHVYIDFDFSKVAGENTLSVWVASKLGYAEDTCQIIDTLDNPSHYHKTLSVDDFGFDLNYVWLIANSDAETGFVNLWIKIDNCVVYTNTLQDHGFTGNTIESHLKELKAGVDNSRMVGTSVIADGYSTITNPWDNNVVKPSFVTQGDGVVSWAAGGDNGVAWIFPKAVDPTKMLRIEFDIETDFNSFDAYVSAGEDLNDGYSVIGHISTRGRYSYLIDPAYWDVYGDGVPKSFFILSHGNGSIASATIRNFRIYQNAVVDAGGLESVEGNFLKLYQREVAPVVTNNESMITAPNGDRYIMQIDNGGALVGVPVVPRKALYIGNSLLSGFGFGMAASNVNSDYYALMNAAIEAKRAGLTASRIAGSDWESCTTISDKETWCKNTLAARLTSDLDLIIVQLGDNVNTPEKKAVLSEGAENLLRFIRGKCPKARVVWVGAWYGADNLPVISAACEKVGCMFINILDLHTTATENVVGATWTDTSGNVNTITSSGVASHPSDAGMKAIANRVLYALSIADTENYYA